jgi:rubrerythrin
MKKLINKLMCNSQNSVNIKQTAHTNIIDNNNILTETQNIENLNNKILTLKQKIDKLETRKQYYKSKYEELQHIEKLSSYYICNICFVNQKNILFMPCSHFVSCLDCMNNSCDSIMNSIKDNELSSTELMESRYKCPICRITVEYYKDIYT